MLGMPTAMQKQCIDWTNAIAYLFGSPITVDTWAFIKQRGVKGSRFFRLPGSTSCPGDATNDASIVWPDNRKTIDLGTITITTVDPDSDAASKALAFDPTRLTDGIELSDDPLPALRSRVYRLSRIHRQGQ
jgi:catalase